MNDLETLHVKVYSYYLSHIIILDGYLPFVFLSCNECYNNVFTRFQK